MLAAGLLLLVASSPAPAAQTAEQSRHDAAVLETTLDAMTARLNAERDEFVLKTVAWAALLKEHSDHGAAGPEFERRREELARAVRADHDRTVVEAVQATLMARRLDEYRRTGVLPPAVKDDGSIARSLDWSAPASSPLPAGLPGDLVALAKSLGLPPPPKAGRVLPPASPAIARAKPAARPAPLFMPDRGFGRAETDPVPGLIAQLSSAQTEQRALAADELAGHGASAASAVPALRRALADADPRVRSSSVTALGAIVAPDSAAVSDIRALLADRSEDVRFSARTALRRLGLSR